MLGAAVRAPSALFYSVPQGEGIWYLQEGVHSNGSGTPMAESRMQVIIGGHDSATAMGQDLPEGSRSVLGVNGKPKRYYEKLNVEQGLRSGIEKDRIGTLIPLVSLDTKERDSHPPPPPPSLSVDTVDNMGS